MKQKQAVLAVSFGTGDADALEKSIVPIEIAVAKAFPEYPCFRAFAGDVIRKKLRDTCGNNVESVPEVLKNLQKDGFTQVILQPLYVTEGGEYERMLQQINPMRDCMNIALGKPLLTCFADCMQAAAAIMEQTPPPEEDEALIFVGHGVAGQINWMEEMLDTAFARLGGHRVFVGTIKGEPSPLYVAEKLREQTALRRVRLYPLMISAGKHASRDIFGDAPDSWKFRLSAQGYEVAPVYRGLGEIPGIGKLFAQHALDAKLR